MGDENYFWIYADDGNDWNKPETPILTVYEDPNPITGVLYGPRGEVLAEFRERSQCPMGFQAPLHEETE